MNARRSRMICVAVLCVALLAGTAADAQSWDASQKEIWTTILESYKDIEKEDLSWTDKWVTPDAKVWGSYPMPRSRDAVKGWDSFNFGRSDTLASEYSPAAIVVHGDMAVAHYYYSTGDKDEEGKTSVTHGKCTDILVRSEGSWRFIAWNCADLPEDD